MRAHTDFAIYVDSDWRTQLKTRVTRDIDQRGYSADKAAALRALEIDADAIGRAGLAYERLDQLLTEHLLGARGADS